MIGETIGNFRITSRLGAGGMGEVFLAEQTNIETKVAIKVLRPEISVDRAHVDRFFNEARAVSRIKHAGTVKIFDVGFHTTGHAYLVMEFLEGETLAARIQRLGRLPLDQLGDFGKQTCSIKRQTPRIRFCFESDPLVAGKQNVRVKFFIGPDGSVKSATASGGSSANCVANVMRRIVFPKPSDGGGVSVELPLTFSQ